MLAGLLAMVTVVPAFAEHGGIGDASVHSEGNVPDEGGDADPRGTLGSSAADDHGA